MTRHKRNHVASRFYLSRWASDAGRIAVVRPPEIKSEERRPDKVGWRPLHWGQDLDLCARVEEAISPIESEAAVALMNIRRTWPLILPGQDRVKTATFMALQMLRSPAARARHHEIEIGLMRKDSVKYKAELSTAAFEQVVSEIVSDQFRVESELQTVPKLAGMLASMHWTLIEFPEPLLATCDQPLQAVPFFGAGEGRPVVAVPDSGMSSIQEVRFPIDPSHCLLLSWKEGVDSADVVVGSDWVAAQVNRVTLAQADREWFHLPGRRPTTLTPPDLSDTRCAALGPVVLTNYSVANAFRSPRRAKINQIVNRMIREGDHETIGVIYPEITDKAA